MRVIILARPRTAGRSSPTSSPVLSPDAARTVLGLATGSSPLPAYRELIRRHRAEGLSFAGVEAFLLDEYVGLPAGHPQAYR